MKRSAGILVYKKENDCLKVLLCHPGGPYWQGTNLHSWGIPKGEVEDDENLKATAIREFKEETNLEIDEDGLDYLASKKVSNNKLVIIFCKKEDFDLNKCKSNTFQLEWPKNSGTLKEFPENDKYEWLDIKDAYDLIFKQQVFFLERLEKRLMK